MRSLQRVVRALHPRTTLAASNLPCARTHRRVYRCLSSTSSPSPSPRAVYLTSYTSSDAASFSLRPFTPPPPSSGEVAVLVLCVSINPIDVMSRAGYGRSVLPFLSPLPRVAGKDAVARITRLGGAVWNAKVGDVVWLSRDPVGDGSWAEQLNCRVGEFSPAPRRLSPYQAAAFPFIWTTLWRALVDEAGLTPVPVREMAERRAASASPPSTFASPRAVVHGAGGPLGRLAVWTLHEWGFEVTATVKESQDSALLQGRAERIVRISAEDEREKEVTSDGRRGSPSSPLSPTPPPPSWLSSLPSRGGYSLFLDCVGGPSSEAVALQALQSGVGRYVTLRADVVSTADEDGLVRGGARGLFTLAGRKAAFASRGLSYHWAINRCNAAALAYLAHAIDHDCIVRGQGEDEEGEEGRGGRRLREVRSGMEAVNSDEGAGSSDWLFHGVDQLVPALEFFSQRKPQGKVLVALDGGGHEKPST